MRKVLVSTLLLCLNASSVFSIKISLFQDTETYVTRARDIIVAECISIEKEKVDVDTDGLRAINVKVLKALKGNRKPGELRIATIYPMKEEVTYLLYNLGGNMMSTDFLAIAELSVVPLPSYFRFSELEGKELKEQIEIIFSRHLFEVDNEYERILAEKKLLEKAVGDRASVWFKSAGPIKLGKIRQASTQSDGKGDIWLDLNGNKLQWSAGNSGKTGYLSFEKTGLSRWSPFWEFSPCEATAINELESKILRAKFYGLFDPHGDETRINWAGMQGIEVKVGQTIFARIVEDLHTVYVIQIVSQSTEKEQMDFRYTVIHD
jgi:hypothetical protein